MAKLIHVSDRVAKQLNSLKEELTNIVVEEAEVKRFEGETILLYPDSNKKKSSYSFLIESMMKRIGIWDNTLEEIYISRFDIEEIKNESSFKMSKGYLKKVIKQRKERIKDAKTPKRKTEYIEDGDVKRVR